MLNEVAPPPPPPPPLESASAATTTTTSTTPPPKFLTYLLPTISRPFRRHRRISSSTGNDVPARSDIPSLSNSPVDSVPSSPASPTSPSWFSHVKHGFRAPSAAQPDVPRLARVHPDTIRCSTCGTDFAFYSQIVSKGFTGRYGRAYLVAPPDGPPRKSGPDLMNVKVGKPESRVLATGAHVVSDIQCVTCRARVGWKYVDAKEETQKYKIGKFILETQRTVDYRNWDDAVSEEMLELEFEPENPQEGSDAEPMVFDSDDSDECDDLFSGVWDARSAAKRRKLRRRR
ncbi:yippee-domain-containing protein [Nemania serpens]|nr:yippee-domain-containing protein [Nemania serpens]